MNCFWGSTMGGTMIKAVLFDKNGKEKSAFSVATEVQAPHPGYAERNLEKLYHDNCSCIRKYLLKSNVDSAVICGISFSGYGKGLYVWNDKKPDLFPDLLSTDKRVWRYPIRWKKEDTFQNNYPQLAQNILATQQISYLAWLRDNDPEVYQNIQYIFSCKDYLRYRFTGEAYSEMSDLLGSGLFNILDRKIDGTMLTDSGLAECSDKNSPISNSSDQVGLITMGKVYVPDPQKTAYYHH